MLGSRAIRRGVIGLVVPAVVGFSAAIAGSKSDFPNPQVARLEMFSGPWEVSEHHYDAEGDRVATFEGKETNTWILEDHAIRRSYQSGDESRVYRAEGHLTWNEAEKKYHGVWFDNVSSTGPSTVKGEWLESENTFVFFVQSKTMEGVTLTHKVMDHFRDERTRVATTYAVNGDALTKRIEVHYKRDISCPGAQQRFSTIPRG